MDLSFAWTTPALVAGHKTVTRRDWAEDYARRFREGMIITALDRQRRYGGKPVAAIKLLRTAYRQMSSDAPEEDYDAEGFRYLHALGKKVDRLTPPALWRVWHGSRAREMWVVRFEVVLLTPYGQSLAAMLPAAVA